MVIKVYLKEASPPARALLMTLDALELPFEIVPCNLLTRDHLAPEYVKKNPLHTIPLFEEGDLIIHDSHAALMYLVDKYGKDNTLYPKDVMQRALVNQKLFFNNSIAFIRLKVIMFNALANKVRNPPEQQLNDIRELYGFAETFLSRSKNIAGDHITIADIELFATISSLNLMIPLMAEKYPHISAWLSNMEKQSFANQNVKGLAEMKNLVEAFLDI